ncbi:MAG: helix-turn-helix transcriptional regulator [Chloroflexi bacterium]|nr:MAG: helix-turn-helix transcriptional regulator [Chloroflexota bacterium]
MTTLRHYRINLGWSIYRLAHEAGISRPAVANAENGQPIKAETAKAIADALSRAYGQDIKPTDIEGLNIL